MFNVANEWDKIIKLLVGSNPQDFVSLLLPGARFREIIDKELQARTIEADLLFLVEWNSQAVILHAEFQRRRDGDMGKRMWEYNALTTIQTQMPVYSFVLYLLPDGIVPESPFELLLSNGKAIHIFHYEVIKLWELPKEELEQPGLEGMLPLLPLSKDGMKRERVEEMIVRLRQSGREDLLAMAYSLAALVFKKTEDREWLRKRFAMLKDILEESWAYQEMIESARQKAQEQGLKQGLEQGLAQGLEQGLEQGEIQSLRMTIVRLIQKWYPQQVSQVMHYVGQIHEAATLDLLMEKLLDAQTENEVAQLFTQQ